MSSDPNISRGCAGWLKWLVGTAVALLAAGGSVVALLDYFGPSEPPVASPPNQVIEVYVPQAATEEPQPVPVDTPLPDEPVVSPELWQEVNDFLSGAVASEILAYQYGDASYAPEFYGDARQALQDKLAGLNSRGLLLLAQFDYASSYIADIRLTRGDTIEVDTCEYWAGDYYDRQTGAWVGSDPQRLVPQTIAIERFNAQLTITSIAFYTGQAFCR